MSMEKYQRIRQIGEGAFGKAILVKQKQNGRQCVIKEISLGRMGPKEREGSRKEVAVLSQLNHPNIVTYLESFEERGTLYICMDYCAGGDLYTKINQQRGALIQEEQIWNYFAQICLAIKHIHDRKILHRDIKSQNIFLTAEGRVKIGDFGIAKVLNNTMELARTCIGTPYYLSPELVENKPYNNKSDVWSLGCVLYEMTTLKHAFEAGNMKNLVLKIIRGVYPPIPPKYSYDLRGIIAQLFKRSPRDRPSINALLRKNIMMQKVRNVLSDEKFAEEFSHTIMHGKKISRALPPPPRPASASSRPTSAASNRPGSAAKKSVNKPRYDPASVYGVPLVKKSRERPDLKKKNNSGGRIIPGQADWDKKRLELKEKERQRREEEKQKKAQINRSRELGWRNILEPGLVKQDDPEPVLQKPQMIIPKQPEHRVPIVEGRGRYDQYNAYLDKLQQDRINRIRDGGPVPMPRPAAVPYMQAGPDPVVGPRLGRDQFQFNRGPQMDPARRDASERARMAQEFLDRKQAAARNKARAQAQLFGNRPPSGGQRAVTPKNAGPPPGAAAQSRDREEQDYLAQLRKIREQNMKERKALQARKDAGTPDLNKYKPPQDEERKKKLEALKKQADDWAAKYDDEKNRNLVAIRRGLEDQAKSRPPSRGGAQNRPTSAQKPAAPAVNMKPAPAVPITGILQAIGGRAVEEPPAVNMKPSPAVPITGVLQAIGGEAAKEPKPVSPSPGVDDKTRQIQKENILKRLNERNRPKWGAQDGAFVPASTAVKEEEPSSARSQWGEGQIDLGLADMTLEETSSKMEATSAGDQVIRSPDGKVIGVVRGAGGSGDSGKGEDSNRQGWGRPGSTVVKVLQGLPIIENTMSSTASGGSDGSQSPAPRVDIVSGIGATVTLSKPSMIREGTITIKSAEESVNNKDALPVAPSLADRNIEEVKAALAAIEDLEELSSQSEEDSDNVQSKQIESGSKITDSQSNSDIQNIKCAVDQSESNEVNSNQTDINSSRQSTDVSSENSNDKPKSEPQLVFKKPVLLPKPDLSSAEFAKPIIAPVVIDNEGEGQLFSKVDLHDDDDDDDRIDKPNWDDAKEKGKMVSKGLSTGNFDINNVGMLRTCSEPDLSKLFQTSDNIFLTTMLTRHASLERLKTVQEEGDEDFELVRPSLEMELLSPRSDTSQPKSDNDGKERDGDQEGVESNNDDENDDFDEEDIDIDDDDNDDNDDEDDDDDDDMISVRETMQSLLIDEDEEEGEKIDRASPSEGDNQIGEDTAGRGDTMNENDSRENKTGIQEKQNDKLSHSQSDSVLNDKHQSLRTDTLSDLFQGDSDDETTFGDDDNNDVDDDNDYDMYGRLEQARAELEESLGFDLFLQVYNKVQEVQEDEDENIEKGAKIALDLLGEKYHHLYPKIFQLVMSDTAFTEDNS